MIPTTQPTAQLTTQQTTQSTIQQTQSKVKSVFIYTVLIDRGGLDLPPHRPYGRWAPGSTMHFFMNFYYVVKHI